MSFIVFLENVQSTCLNFLVISGQTKSEKKYLKVSCSGACSGINILLDPSEGDPDLCARYSFPLKHEQDRKVIQCYNECDNLTCMTTI